MRQRKNHFRCSGCGAAHAQPYPICERCDRPMDSDGDKFFDYISIQKLRRSQIYDAEEGQRYYVFQLVIGGFVVHGMTYNADKRSVMFPGSGGNRFMAAPGMTLKRIQDTLDHLIAKLEGEEEESFDDSPIAA